MTPSDYVLGYLRRGDEIDRLRTEIKTLKNDAEVQYQRGGLHGLAIAYATMLIGLLFIAFLIHG